MGRAIVPQMIGSTPPDGGAESTSRPEHALLSLKADLHPEWAPVLEKIGFKPKTVKSSLQALSGHDLTEAQRLRVLHDLHRTGRLQEQELREPALNLARGIVPEDRFDAFMTMTGGPDIGLEEFVELMNQQGMTFKPLKVVDPHCTDLRTGGDGSPTRIFASFEIEGAPRGFVHGTNPLNWPGCNSFFIDVSKDLTEPWTPLPAIDNVDGTAYRGRIKEVVGIKSVWTPTTHLDVRYFVTNNAVGMEFTFACSDGWIDVDHGYVLVQAQPSKPNCVLVTSEKNVRFVGISNFPATLACELGWIDVMQNMASCRPVNQN